MTILAELRADIDEALRGSSARTLLWLDPQHEWEPLLGELPADFELLKYDGSQLQLRAEIERRASDKPQIVYVPLSRLVLTVLKEYEFILPSWDESLLHALQRWGVGIEREEEKALLALLPGLAARWCDKPMDYWRHLTPTGVRARLFDDELVRVFLADPDEITAGLEREGALDIFRDFLDEAFGVPPEIMASPGEVARRLVQNLILAEASEQGGLDGFPYQDRLAQPGARERCVRFLNRWLEARTQSQIASRLLRDAESDLQLGSWAKALVRIPDMQSSLQVERALVDRVQAEVKACASIDKRATLLAECLPMFRRHASHFWAVEGEVPEWQALAFAGAVAAGAQEALAELVALRTAPAIVQAYVVRWWKVDQAYRHYRAGFEAHQGLDEVAETVRRLHRRYLEETNKRFAECLEGPQGLLATGLAEPRSFWPSGDVGRRAVLVLDAFRFDLARELEAKLRGVGGQTSVDLGPMRAPLPSITPIGMASLLPLDGIQVTVRDGVWSIRAHDSDATGPDLATKEGRERLLTVHLPGYASVDLRKLLDMSVHQVPKTGWLFVYSTALDEAGHGGVLGLTPRAAEEYVEQCARAVRKLANAGVEEVHVVTDHGFFLLDDLADHDLIPVKAKSFEYKSHRAVVGREIASPSLLTFPLSGSDLTVGVPRATGILEARGGYQFFHGGASLQEIVVPHLRVTFPRRAAKLGVHVQAPSRITSLLFDVELEAISQAGQLSFGGRVSARFVDIRLHLLDGSHVVEPPLASASDSELFVSEAQMRKRVRIRIPEGARFQYGDTVRIVVKDADPPRELLATAEAVLKVEPGF